MKGQTPKHNGRVFRADPSKRNVFLNWRNAPEREFEYYAQQYHQAAKILVRKFRFSYCQAPPIVFLYRHTIELFMKATIYYGNLILAELDVPFDDKLVRKIYSSHTLTRLFPYVKRVVTFMGGDWDFHRKGLRGFDDLHAILRDIDSVDSGSYSFRYPVNKYGRNVLPQDFEFDLDWFVKTLDLLVISFDCTLETLKQYYDNLTMVEI